MEAGSKASVVFIGWFLVALLLFVGCATAPSMKCEGRQGWSYPGPSNGELSVFLDATVSLADASALSSLTAIQRKSFCVGGSALQLYPANQSVNPPCFHLMNGQSYIDEFFFSDKIAEVIDPQKFFSYYKSIPSELNLFLVIQIKDFYSALNSLRKLESDPASTPPILPENLWPGDFVAEPSDQFLSDATQLSLYGLLHTTLFKDSDAFLYIYLPLNIGIKILEYSGVLPNKARFKTEINNFANPTYRLTEALQQSLELSAYRAVGECEAFGYKKISLKSKITPEMLRPAIQEYKKKVQSYLNQHSAASFQDPYASP